jgi:peptidoglycan/xylan/chitin deacetylase (PgdA/CDA1 family)
MIAILAYHSLDQSSSVLSTSPGIFAEQMKVLYEAGVKVLSLSDVAYQIQTCPTHANEVVITFDDGFRSVYDHAFPVLRTYNFPATVFLVTDYCEKTNSWPGQTVRLDREPLLRWREVQEMSQAGVSFGSHTRTHPDLRKLSLRQAEEELVGSKKAIADATGQPADMLAYPYGGFDTAVRNLATQHFRLSCSTALGFVQPGSDLFALERIEMYYFRSLWLFRHLFSPTTAAYLELRKQLRRLRRVLEPAPHVSTQSSSVIQN